MYRLISLCVSGSLLTQTVSSLKYWSIQSSRTIFTTFNTKATSVLWWTFCRLDLKRSSKLKRLLVSVIWHVLKYVNVQYNSWTPILFCFTLYFRSEFCRLKVHYKNQDWTLYFVDRFCLILLISSVTNSVKFIVKNSSMY